MSPQYFVEVRRTLGGPAPTETARAVAASRTRCSRATVPSGSGGAIIWATPTDNLHVRVAAL